MSALTLDYVNRDGLSRIFAMYDEGFIYDLRELHSANNRVGTVEESERTQVNSSHPGDGGVVNLGSADGFGLVPRIYMSPAMAVFARRHGLHKIINPYAYSPST